MPYLEVTTKKPELSSKKGKCPDFSEHAFTAVLNSLFSRFSRQNESKTTLTIFQSSVNKVSKLNESFCDRTFKLVYPMNTRNKFYNNGKSIKIRKLSFSIFAKIISYW